MILVRRTVQSLVKTNGRGSVISLKMSSSSGEVVLNSVKEKGVIVLNRPKALNALNLEMIRQIFPALQQWEKEKSMVLIKGVGDKAFCAGGDVRAVTDAGKKGDSLTKDFFREEYQLNSLIGTLQIPYVALIHGITMGGGVGLSVHGRYRVATEKTLFAMPETAIGLFPDVGGSYFLPRLGGNLGMYLALTGYRLKGVDVLKAGISTHICHSSNIADLEKELLENSPAEIDNILHAYSEKSPELKSQEFSLTPAMKQIENIFSAGSVEEIVSRLEGEGSKWSQDTLATLLKMSPTSLKVTFKQIKEGASKDLQECLQMEYRLTQRFCADHDFYEGVRSVLIDRDNNPKWCPSTLSGVSQKKVEEYFALLPENEELQL